MKASKKIVAIVLAASLVIPTTAFAASEEPDTDSGSTTDVEETVDQGETDGTSDGETGEPDETTDEEGEDTTIDISTATVTVENSLVYTGKMQTADIVAVDQDGNVLEEGTDYILNGERTKAACTHKAVLSGIGKYSGTTTVDYKIKKAAQELTATVEETGTKKYSCKASDLEDEDQTFQLDVSRKGKMKIRYWTTDDKITVDNHGEVTLEEGLESGTYKIKVFTSATQNYKFGKAVNIKITVK